MRINPMQDTGESYLIMSQNDTKSNNDKDIDISGSKNPYNIISTETTIINKSNSNENKSLRDSTYVINEGNL